MFVNPDELIFETRKGSLTKLHKHTSKVCAALISMGHYNFEVQIENSFFIHGDGDKVAKISQLPANCPYYYILVYEDGYVGYYDVHGGIQFEGNTKRSAVISMDILQK